MDEKGAGVVTYFNSSVGKKQIMGVTGLLLSLFVLGHMSGNLLYLVSPEAYNKYGHGLTSSPLIYLIEAGLLILFLSHVGLGLRLTLENKSARPQSYYVPQTGDKAGTGFAAKSMILSGLLLFVFAVWHLITFKFGPYYEVTYNGVVMRDLHLLMTEVFRKPLYFGWYIFSMIVLGLHLSHGFQSGFQSLGLVKSGLEVRFRYASVLFALVVALGFMSVPITIFFKG